MPRAARILAHDSASGAFTPGMVLAGRFRIIGLLGRGGMGDVYRADDLKLGQPVALKFLPRELASEADRRERFVAEVRLARQVTHPNVCRVYDIGELEGRQYLSMEYVDGEDLRSLLDRIGRLPPDKALDAARQLCAGVAAAHERGVLHRDLKPANVMLDGRGRVRVMDFGLAAAPGATDTDTAGTPAYMAPEQLAGKAATVRSDIYALGLVLYELYTGRRAFDGPSLAAILAAKERGDAARPAALVPDMDPAVERVILRAMARDAAERPSSVAELAAALPGGTPLQAALRAGETPSPDMVAASRGHEGVEPRVAWLLLVLTIALAAGAVALASSVHTWRRAAFEKSPAALADRAREIRTHLGYAADAAYRASGYDADIDHLLRKVVPLLIWRWPQSVMGGLAILVAILLLRPVLRSQPRAMAAYVVLHSLIASLPFEQYWIAVAMSVLFVGALVLLLRVGLLAAVVAMYTSGLFVLFPVTGDLQAWYAGAGVSALVVFFALTAFGFVNAVGARPLLGRLAIDD